MQVLYVGAATLLVVFHLLTSINLMFGNPNNHQLMKLLGVFKCLYALIDLCKNNLVIIQVVALNLLGVIIKSW